MTPPSRATSAGRAYLDLQKRARAARRPVDEYLQLYVLECFLARLSASPYARSFILKGGMLLAAFGERRPTRDIDFLAHRLRLRGWGVNVGWEPRRVLNNKPPR